jgi:HAE1 family hydrophobic/amphiphilic exporter-1
MLCSRFLKPHTEQKGSLVALSERGFNIVLDLYRETLSFALNHKLIVVAVFFGMVVGTAVLFEIMPKGFMPSEDSGQIIVMTEGEQGISYDAMVVRHKELTDMIQKDPNVQSVMSSIGVGNGSPNLTLNQGRILIVLKPLNERHLKVDQIIHELAPKLATIHGISTYLQNPPSITIGGQVTKSLYQYTLSSPNTNVLYSVSKDLVEKIKSIPGVIDVTTDLEVDNPEVHVQVDRDKLSELGLNMLQVEDALDSAYSARQISTMYTSANQYWVIIEVAPRYYRDPNVLHDLYIHSSTGQLVRLDAVAAITLGRGPLLVNHLGQFPSVTISFNLKPEASLGDAVAQIRKMSAAIVPASVTTSFQGTASAFEDSLGNLWVLLILAIVVIYIVLGILYESFVHPLTILSGLPSAGLGALAILLLCHIDLDIYGFLGLIMLIGIVKKNAIMMIDFALEAQRHHGKSSEEAIYEACLTRFRPIMMTTMAALMGGIPIALGIGAGAETRQPLGLTVVGGLLVSQLVTLYITPVFYIYLDKLQERLTKHKVGDEVASKTPQAAH